ncbi:MAG: AMP-binding protein [Solirubrobacterales bacterium]|nr:AMP-binding protein [Solirubrobacterales bacterium]
MAPAGTIPALLTALASARPDTDAACFPTSRSTFAQLEAASLAKARALRAAGIGAGDLVGLLMAAGLAEIELLAGLWYVGAVPVPINPRYKPPELAYVVEHSRMELLVCDAAGMALAAQAGVACPVVVVSDDGGFPASAGLADPDDVARLSAAVTPGDDAIVLYTSGTTSNPKGAIHTHAGLVAEGRNVAARLGLGPGDRFWSALPLFHCGGYCTMMAAWAAGATFVHPGAFEAGIALAQLEGEQCTFAFPAFEMIWLAALDHPSYATADLSALRVVVNVGVPERLRQMQERMPGIVQISSFGSTESCGFICIGDVNDPLEARVTTSGRILPGMELRIVDPETGEEAELGQPGEALFRGVTRFSRYHRDPVHTSKVIDAEGWFHSGDLVSCDEEGRIRFEGRLKDMLKVGGENVSPAEVEDYLLTHPAVGLAQVVAAPDARLIEVPCAFVQLAPGATVTQEELIEYCLGRIATFKVPRYVRFVADWPMSGTKIQKHRLRERIAAELREAGITAAPRLTSTVRA